ncbi:hypothetical protein A5717_26025 [Mycolicibacterium porcinum]|uniref:hypothetical protein n=1 Tax=Mycolicibacterium porcinum TaxID=39693 RepID=UPI00080BECAE|nr:hypothetical protein [Mycolicibacterium porcinum]OCB09236.1 hypothetical protein A5717_26025 [Mycolicibacterium porcinum]
MDLIDLADQAAAAADLDDQARGRIQSELQFGDADYALTIAVLETRKPLPTDLLKQIRSGADQWFRGSTRSLVLDAVRRQELANAA